MRTRTRLISAVIAAFVIFGVAADAAALTGRDVARDGELTRLKGTLEYRDNEWFLDTPGGSYEVHMGPLGHEESSAFSTGALAHVWGFAIPEHIAPISVTTDGDVYEFWHEERYPLWAGNGDRRNAAEDRGSDGAGRTEGSRGLAVGRAEEQQFPGKSAGSEEELEPRFRNQDQRPGQGR